MKAIFYNLLAWAILPFMDTIAKYLSAELSFFQITWARYFFTVFFTRTIGIYDHISQRLNKCLFYWLIYHNYISTYCAIIYFNIITYLFVFIKYFI